MARLSHCEYNIRKTNFGHGESDTHQGNVNKFYSITQCNKASLEEENGVITEKHEAGGDRQLPSPSPLYQEARGGNNQ